MLYASLKLNERKEVTKMSRPIGYWVAPNEVRPIRAYTKPNLFVRLLTLFLIGWKWQDNERKDSNP